MRIFFLLFIGTILLTPQSFSQNWNREWERQLKNGVQDYFVDVVETKDNALAVLGSTNVGDKSDLWILKLSNIGDTIWTQKVGTNKSDVPSKIVCLNTNDLLILSQSGSGANTLTLLICIDESGNEKWRKNLETEITGRTIFAVDDNGFLLGGSKNSDENTPNLWLSKMDLNGEIIWEKIYRESQKGCVVAAKQLPNGEIILGTQIEGEIKNDCDMQVIRADKDGNEIWSNQLESPNSKEWPECICCTPDSCFVLVGWLGNCLNDIASEYPVFDFDMVIKKMDCEGNVVWSKSIDAEGSEGGNAVSIRPDGKFIVAGTKLTSFTGKLGPWLLYMDQEGNIIDELLLDMQLQQASKVINTTDGGFVVIGPGLTERPNPRSKGWIIKFSEM